MVGHAYSAVPGRAAHAAGREVRPGAGGAMRVAGLSVLALALVWVVAELLPAAQVRDAILLRHFTLLSGPHVDTAARLLLDLLSPFPLAFWGLSLVLLALYRGRPREALAVAVVIALAPLCADLLKPLLAHTHARAGAVHIGPASWPSGHSTAALALALCATLVAPPRARLSVALAGAAFALAVGCALLIRAWHMPSDVLGGYLMAVLWMALAVAGLRAAERRWPGRPLAGGRVVRAGLPQGLGAVGTLHVGRAAEDEQQV
jgi:membrane-associated phospholipid phosphatase